MCQFSRHGSPSLFLLRPALIPDHEEPDENGDQQPAGLEVWNPLEARKRGRISEKYDVATGADDRLAARRDQASYQDLHLLLSFGGVDVRLAGHVLDRQNAVGPICHDQGDVRPDHYPLKLKKGEVEATGVPHFFFDV